ncbi:MAG TPA: Rne/Rng family ribonuclease [Limnochordia bacterium]|nr:Rne/Rng family ribonuclease [Limnochordia bacterium]HXK98361.1 Rne/Rng family ribonuclease [Limnochordia bacterium]
MLRKVVISSFLNQVLVGIVENGRLAEFFMERDETSRIVGNIYKGKVENVLPGMAAAFVDLGLERNGFLYVADLPGERDRPINELVKKGQEILVQVAKEPEGSKGPRVEANISLPGRFMVLMPQEDTIGVSRQIPDPQERSRLRELAGQLKPEGMGLIVRTAACGRSAKELEEERNKLVKLWRQIEKQGRKRSAPALLYRDHDLIYRIMRDVVTDDTQAIIVDQPWIYDRIIDIRSKLHISPSIKVDLYQGEVALFDQLGLSRDLEKATHKRVWLNSGGYLIIDQTEALVSIDVNTGRYTGSKNLAETVLRTNLEAAHEIAKQLRLRNIGGIVIIDFIDMESARDRQLVLDALTKALAADKTKSHVLGFTQLGLVEMTRKKAKTRLSHLLETPCPQCGGAGSVLSCDTIAINTAQKIYSTAREPGVKSVHVSCHPLVAAVLIGKNRENLRLMRKQTGKKITITGCEEFELDYVEISHSVK